jgi:hypothetical protein
MITRESMGNFNECYSCKKECNKELVYGLQMCMYEKEKKYEPLVFADSLNNGTYRVTFILFCVSCWEDLAGSTYSFNVSKLKLNK